MAIYRGPGGPGDAVADAGSTAALISTLVTQAETAASNAASSSSSASTSASNANTSATNAATSATAASNSATSAAASLAAIGSSEANAAASASAAATSATNAANSATSAGSSATSATSSASAASSSASAASTSASNAASSASSAATSATNAANSAATASTAATNASNSASAAATSASNASTSATNAANSATASASSASTASTAATNASNSASAAATSASNAATSETNAAASASAAATSATNASNSASAAATSASNAAASYDAFDDRYLGAKSSAPALDNDGNALLTGALYWNTTGNQLYVWDGSAWDDAAFNVTGGAVTSVDMTVPTGLLVSGNPITTAGTLAVTYASGYAIPTTVKQSNWDDAYTFVTNFPTQTGNSGKYLTTDGSTLSWGTVSYTETDPVVGAINGIVKANGSGTISAATAGTDYLSPAAIGVTVQAYDAGLQSIAGLTTAADRMIYTTAADTYAVTTLTAAGRALIDDANASAQRTTLGLVIGTDVQAYDVDTAKLDVVQTWTAQQTFKELKDTVHTITDGAAFEIDPVNGSIQIVTLGANRTPAATNFEAGQVVLLGIDDGTAYTITWTTVNPTWVKAGGTASAPTLATTGYTWILLWKVGSTIYGTEVGQP